MARRVPFMDALMAEPIAMPGCPDLIVTRGDAYQQLTSMGYPLVGGFGSVDYMVFRRPSVEAPLSPEPMRAAVFAAMNRE